jgi:hypothetical protein
MRMIFFTDPLNGWTWWTPPLPVQGGPRGDDDQTLSGGSRAHRRHGTVWSWWCP